MAAKENEKSYEGLARRYRPQTFSDVIGQPHVVKTLKRAIEKNRIAHAYLFIGGRGLGKTTMARILAKALNCESGTTTDPCGECESCREIANGSHLDVMEIDAASNTGIDNVRETIIQAVATAPARGRYKVFIIDETHMLSAQAFGALLKTIEEPPSHVIFVMATTEGHKVPAPIRSRCQRFDFRPVAIDELADRLGEIAKREKISVDAEAIRLICEYAEGGVRDALSSLDLARSYSADKITLALAEEALGILPSSLTTRLMNEISAGDAAAAEKMLTEVWNHGADCGEIQRAILNSFRKALLADIRGASGNFSRGRLVRSIEAILASMDRARFSRHPQIELEVLVAKLAGFSDEEISLKEIYARLVKASPGERGSAAPTASTPQSFTAAAAASRKTNHSADREALLTIFKKDDFFRELKAISPSAVKYCEKATINIPEEGVLRIVFSSKDSFERFSKDKKAAVDIKKAAEFSHSGKMRIVHELSADASEEEPEQKELKLNLGDSKTKEGTESDVDDEIERIKRLFGADSVEIIE